MVSAPEGHFNYLPGKRSHARASAIAGDDLAIDTTPLR
jgi:hypothetical protein